METKMNEPGAPAAQERRKFPRYRCQGSAEIYAESGGGQQWGTVTDFSRGGCYIETPAPVRKGQVVSLRLTLANMSFAVTGTVVVVHPMFGMGVAFTHIDPDSAAIAALVLKQVAGSAPQTTRQTPVPPAQAPVASRPTRLTPQAAVAMLGQIARHLAQHGTLTQQEFLAMLEKNKS